MRFFKATFSTNSATDTSGPTSLHLRTLQPTIKRPLAVASIRHLRTFDTMDSACSSADQPAKTKQEHATNEVDESLTPNTPPSRSLATTTPSSSEYPTSVTSWRSVMKAEAPERESKVAALIAEKRENLLQAFKRLEPHTGKFDEEWLEDRLICMERTWRSEMDREYEERCRAEFKAGVRQKIVEEPESPKDLSSEAAVSLNVSASPSIRVAQREKMKLQTLGEESTLGEDHIGV